MIITTRWGKSLGLALLGLLIAWAPLQAKEAVPAPGDPVIEKRLALISEELRCLVCQNESLASSRAELANDLREEVRKLLREDQSDAQIKAYLVMRYGDFVLYRPEVKPLTWVLWFGPFAMLLLGLLGLMAYIRERQSVKPAQAPLSEEDRRKVERILNRGDAP